MVKQNNKSKDNVKLLTNRLKAIVTPPIPNNEHNFKNRLSGIMNLKTANPPLKNRITEIKIVKNIKEETVSVTPKKQSKQKKNADIKKTNQKDTNKKFSLPSIDVLSKKIPKLNSDDSNKKNNQEKQKIKIEKLNSKKKEAPIIIAKKTIKTDNSKKKSLKSSKSKDNKKNVGIKNSVKKNTVIQNNVLKERKQKNNKNKLKDASSPKDMKGKNKSIMETKIKEQVIKPKIIETKENIKPSIPAIVNLEEIITTDATPIMTVNTLKVEEETKEKISESKNLTEYFGFDKNPFGDSLDTSFLYKSNQHEAALIKLLMSIEHDISFGLTFGKSGTGKTLLSQAILEKLPKDKYLPILVPVTPDLSKTALLNILLKEFGYDFNKPLRDTNQMVDALSELILLSYKSGVKPVIMMDECHFLSSSALHILRTLSNFEAFNKKLITCLLFAEDRFIKRLSNPSYASLRNRIYLEVEILQLKEDDCKNYINHRLSVAGYKGKDFFTSDEIKTICKNSLGIPRAINKECMKIMVDKYLSNK